MPQRQEPTSTVLILVRYVMPAVVVVGGILAVVLSPTLNSLEGAAGIIGAGLSIALLNALHRMGVRGDVERDEELDARGFFDIHGHWPDETPDQARQGHRRGTAAIR